MNRINSKVKGAKAERDVIGMLWPAMAEVSEQLGIELVKPSRNLEQSRAGGCDLNDVPGFAVEVKFHAKPKIYDWWLQAKRQAEEIGLEPILAYKVNGWQWRFRVVSQVQVGSKWVRGPVEMDEAFFLVWFKLKLIQHLSAQK